MYVCILLVFFSRFDPVTAIDTRTCIVTSVKSLTNQKQKQKNITKTKSNTTNEKTHTQTQEHLPITSSKSLVKIKMSTVVHSVNLRMIMKSREKALWCIVLLVCWINQFYLLVEFVFFGAQTHAMLYVYCCIYPDNKHFVWGPKPR